MEKNIKNTETSGEQVGSDENSYRSILKRASAFGGVQMFNILINLVRGKFVAMFLGPEGMGVSSLLTSSTAPLQQFCSLGLNIAFVKEISAARRDNERFPVVVKVATTMILLTSLLGGVACIALAPLLSEWSFGNHDFTLAYVALGIFVALSIAGTGYLALLQGLGSVKRLSKASLVGSLSGLLFGVPLYYFYDYKGIVPSMIIMSVFVFLFYYIGFKKDVKVETSNLRKADTIPLVRKMISIGFIMMIGTLIGSAVNYAINVYVRAMGNLDDVGLFQAANSLTNQYMGIVFSALAMDYFPRLSAVSGNRREMSMLVNRQSEVVLLIATPLVLCMIVWAPLIIDLLLTESYRSSQSLLRWMAFGVLVQAWVFPLSYLFIANDNRKIYFWMEAVESNLMWLGCSLLFYYLYGLIGLGYSLVVRGLLDMVISYFVCRYAYGFNYRLRTLGIVSVNMLLGGAGCLFSLQSDAPYSLPAVVVLLGSVIFSVVMLRRLSAKNKPA